MGTVQKRADELKPGDVLARTGDYGRRIVCAIMHGSTLDENIRLRTYAIHSEVLSLVTAQPYGMVDVEVESSALTSAQQHAEELAELLDIATSDRRGYDNLPEWVRRAEVVLDKIKPPESPTLEEALAALNAVAGMPGAFACKEIEMADAVLDRARRAGLLK